MSRRGLTRREREVCIFVCFGLSNAEIGARLSIGAKTVEDHRANAMRKFGVSSSAMLVRKLMSLDQGPGANISSLSN